MSWQNAPDFSRGLLAGFGFVDTLFQRRRMMDLQEREIARANRLDAENVRRYETEQQRIARLDAMNAEDRQRGIMKEQQDQANELWDRHALSLVGAAGYDFDKLTGQDRDFVNSRMLNPALSGIYGNWQRNEYAEAAEAREAARERDRRAREAAALQNLVTSLNPPEPTAMPAAPTGPLPKSAVVMQRDGGAPQGALPGPNPALVEPDDPWFRRGLVNIATGSPEGFSVAPNAGLAGETLLPRPAPQKPGTMSQNDFWVGVARGKSTTAKYREQYDADPARAVRTYAAVRSSLTDDARTVVDPYIVPKAREVATRSAEVLRAMPENVDQKSPEFRAAKRDLDNAVAVLANAAKTPPSEIAEIRSLAMSDGAFDPTNPNFLPTAVAVATGQGSPYPYASPGQVRGALTTVSRIQPGGPLNARQMNAAILALGAGVPAAAVNFALTQAGVGQTKLGTKEDLGDGQMGLIGADGVWRPIINGTTGQPLLDPKKAEEFRGQFSKDHMSMIERIAEANEITGDVQNDVTIMLATAKNNADMIMAAYGIDASRMASMSPEELAPLFTNIARWNREKRDEDVGFVDVALNRLRGYPYGGTGEENVVNFRASGANRRIEIPRTQLTPQAAEQSRQAIIFGRAKGATADDYKNALLGPEAFYDYLNQRALDTANRPSVASYK